MLAVLHACAHHDARLAAAPGERQSGSTCPFGRDYGSGMVALGLCPTAHRAFVLTHEILLAEAPDLVPPEVFGGTPYAPHVSVVYGVTENNREAVAACLHEQARRYPEIVLEVDALELWDLGDTGKTALVAILRDRDGHLAALHQALQPLLQSVERYPYRPHITLATLARRRRPPDELLGRLRARLAIEETRLRVAWLTDRCGLPGGYEAFAPDPPALRASPPR